MEKSRYSMNLAACVAALSALALAGAAAAQATTDAATPPQPADTTAMAPMAAPPTMAVAGQAPAAQVTALAQGDNSVVTNGPVPDTAANRAKYGAPLSHAGKKTAPAGN